MSAPTFAPDSADTTPTENVFDVLTQRGLIAQCTESDDVIRERLSIPTTVYCGFDPTADSLHVGSLVPMLALTHLQRAGHHPLVVVGGGTALVGDPSGKTEARQMLSRDQIDENAGAVGDQIGRVVQMQSDAKPGGLLLNNADWLSKLTWVDLLRDVGRHFSVNRMLTMDSVKNRMQTQGEGISFLEFNYMVMQAYDFVHLYRQHGCTLQIGGQDQWGNIVMGIDLARRMEDVSLAGLTLPLVTKSDGSKFGKSEAGNIWLDAKRTSVFDFFQFWRNTADRDVATFLARFTLLPMQQVRELCDGNDGPAINHAKSVLAHAVTALVHGPEAADQAAASARQAFEAGDATAQGVPHLEVTNAELEGGVGLLELLVRGGLAKTNGDARRLVQGGGVRVNDEKVADPRQSLTVNDVCEGHIVLRAGKKRFLRLDVV